jgi:GNAT superfamily N-acetyltransferase
MDQKPGAIRFDFLTAEDIEGLLQLEPRARREELQNWFLENKLCFGARDGSRLVAKMWCDLEAFHYPPNYRILASDEAYLFAAYTDPDYRGRDLAPLMRTACYAALQKMGRNRFYSYTEYFNTAARRFKEKLGARNEALRVHIDLFGRWSRTLTLRRYG